MRLVTEDTSNEKENSLKKRNNWSQYFLFCLPMSFLKWT